MIVGKNYIFLHVPKTGGTWIRSALSISGSREHEYQGHPAFNTLPEELKNSRRRVFLFIRNPWDWYVSLYTHYHSNFEKKIHEFKGPPNNWNDSSKFLAERFGGSFKEMLEHMRPEDTLTHAVQTISEGAVDPLMFRYEDGLANCLLGLLGNSFNTTVQFRIRRMENSRFNAHSRALISYYDEALTDLVRSREHTIIDRFGYLPIA